MFLGIPGKRFVEATTTNVGSGTIDIGICLRISEKYSIGLGSYPISVDMKLPREPEVAVTASSMIPRGHCADAGKQRTWNSGQRMKEQVVRDC